MRRIGPGLVILLLAACPHDRPPVRPTPDPGDGDGGDGDGVVGEAMCGYGFKGLYAPASGAPRAFAVASRDYDAAGAAADAGVHRIAAQRYLDCARRFRDVADTSSTRSMASDNAEVCYYNAAYAFATAGLWATEGKAALERAAAADPREAGAIAAVLADPPTDCGHEAATPPQPVAAREVVTDTYHGVTVEDPYRWLEGDDAAVEAWSDAENAHTRDVLDHLAVRAALHDELQAILAAPQLRYVGFHEVAGKLFALRKDPAKDQPELIVMDGLDDVAGARLVVDPVASFGKLSTIDWYVPSPDGTRLAVSISAGGSEAGTLHVLDLDGKEVDVAIPDVQRGTGGGDVAWRPDGKGFWYTRYPAAGEKPDDERSFWMQVWWHELGKPVADDRYELGKDLPKIAEIQLDADARGRVLASVQDGDGGTFRHYLRDARGAWRQLTDWKDAVVWVGFGPTDDLWLVSNAGAPRGKLLRLPVKARKPSQAKVVVPQGQDTIVTDFYNGVGPTIVDGKVYLAYQVGGPSEVRAFTLAGKPATGPSLPPVSSVGFPIPIGHDLLISSASFVTAPGWSRFHPADGTTTVIPALSPPPPVTLDGFTVRRELATSKDGTQVPVNIVWPEDAATDGTMPCLVTGYGGYGLSQAPYYVQTWQPLLRRGMCFVLVNLRGGGEFGEDWHRAGMLTKKQNVFDDMAAALRYLIDQGYTRSDRLAILGGSNGGLLMGAILTQHPELVHAVVSSVGIYDSLRVELSSNGAFNIPEFGTVADPDQFKALYAYSPYHHVVAGTTYPAILMSTGANDPRVEPMQSRKMIAALQAAQAGDAPILLRISKTSGHGIGTGLAERIDQLADTEAFLAWQLGLDEP
ncbi:MAG: S9 family peptidase [Myxococcales bacterium]|nr:S9 family peptidase [Myxococcales bacterium]